MSALPLVTESIPDWVIAEMPPGYQNRVVEIQRLSEEIRSMDRFGALALAGCETSGAEACTMRCRTWVRSRADTGFNGRIRNGQAGCAPSPVAPFAPRPTTSFRRRALSSRTSSSCCTRWLRTSIAWSSLPTATRRARPEDRPESIEPEALNLLRRLGANVLPGPTLFSCGRYRFRIETAPAPWVDGMSRTMVRFNSRPLQPSENSTDLSCGARPRPAHRLVCN